MWVKSTYSNSNGCLEWWYKSSYSMADGNCLEVANGIRVRDSKDPDGVILRFSPDTWTRFLSEYR